MWFSWRNICKNINLLKEKLLYCIYIGHIILCSSCRVFCLILLNESFIRRIYTTYAWLLLDFWGFSGKNPWIGKRTPRRLTEIFSKNFPPKFRHCRSEAETVEFDPSEDYIYYVVDVYTQNKNDIYCMSFHFYILYILYSYWKLLNLRSL